MTTPFIHDSAERQGAGGRPATQLSPEAQTFNWLLDSFTSGTAGVLEAVGRRAGGRHCCVSAPHLQQPQPLCLAPPPARSPPA